MLIENREKGSGFTKRTVVRIILKRLALITVGLFVFVPSVFAAYQELDGIVAVVEDDVVLVSELMLRIDAVRKQEPTRKKKTLVPSKPVIKPTERRRRRAPSQKSLSRKRK